MKVREKRTDRCVAWIARDGKARRAWQNRRDRRKRVPRTQCLVECHARVGSRNCASTVDVSRLNLARRFACEHAHSSRPCTDRNEITDDPIDSFVLADTRNFRMSVEHLLEKRRA
jgi:hypothetical protein